MKPLQAVIVAIAMMFATFGMVAPANAVKPDPNPAPAAKKVPGKGCSFHIPGACGKIMHNKPDNGYDAPFRVRCVYGKASTEHYVYEGESSSKYCKYDTDQVYVAAGDDIICRKYDTFGPWVRTLYKTGWNKINNLWRKKCVHMRDGTR